MLAVIEVNDKQYIVEEGSIIDVDTLPEKEGEVITIKNTLLTYDEKTTSIGQPYLKNVTVKADVLESFKDRKIIVFKFKRKTGYKKTQGHKQGTTRLKIKSISTKSETKKTEAKTEEKPKKTTAKKTTPKKEDNKKTDKE